MSDVAAEFEWYADWASDASPLYERLARSVTDDPELLDIAAGAREGQPAPQLLLAAVHALLLAGCDHRLAAYYPTCADDPRPPDADLEAAFREFCLANEAAPRETVANRRVQTNEVGRAAVLLPAFERVARATGSDRFATVEIGASAGLNLYWDRFRYGYEGYGTYGDPRSPVGIETAVRGSRDPPLPERLPEVVARVGIDLEPLDVTDHDDAGWLRALVVPDQTRRPPRGRDGLRLQYADPLPVRRGGNRETPEPALGVRTRPRGPLALRGPPGGDRPSDVPPRSPLGETAGERRLAEYQSYGEWLRWLADG